MLEIAVKCIGWLWRARAMLSSSCFDTLSAVVVSYATTARSSAMLDAHPLALRPRTAATIAQAWGRTQVPARLMSLGLSTCLSRRVE